jgi:dihydroorotase-like cyclic amidohydrolase
MCDMCEFAAAGDEPPPRVFTASGDAAIGKFAVGDALIEGAKILQAAASLNASDAAVVDATGQIVIPGFL